MLYFSTILSKNSTFGSKAFRAKARSFTMSTLELCRAKFSKLTRKRAEQFEFDFLKTHKVQTC